MGRFEEFAKTLEAKIRRDIESELMPKIEADFLAGEQDDLPRGFAWIWSQQPANPARDSTLSARGRQVYGRYHKPPPPHVLTPAQSEARALFARFGGELSDSFRIADLRQAWRRVARRTHPDHGGRGEDFRRAFEAYEALKGVFKRPGSGAP